MDKPAGTPAYIPPLTRTNTNQASDSPGNVAASHWQASERNSFESALNKIRDRSQYADLENKPAEATESDVIKNISDDFEEEALDELSEQALLSDEQLPLTEQATSVRQSSSLSTDSSQSLIIDMALGGPGSPGGVLVEGSVVEGVAPASVSSPASAAGSPFTAETIAQMMLRLERTASTHNGQWRFGVLNDQAGVTALQLQRSVQGGWRVNVSFDEAAQIDEQQQADELKAALLKEGHAVDSVVISRLAAHLSLDD